VRTKGAGRLAVTSLKASRKPRLWAALRTCGICAAAALGLLDRLGELLGVGTNPELVSQELWHACAAGRRRAAERLLGAGADPNREPDYAHATALDVATGLGTQRENVVEWLQSIGSRATEDAE